MKPIIPSGRTPVVTTKGLLLSAFRTFLSDLADMHTLSGTGSPEGVVEARSLKRYMDDAGTAGAILYIKQVDDIGGDKSLGWILV